MNFEYFADIAYALYILDSIYFQKTILIRIDHLSFQIVLRDTCDTVHVRSFFLRLSDEYDQGISFREENLGHRV